MVHVLAEEQQEADERAQERDDPAAGGARLVAAQRKLKESKGLKTRRSLQALSSYGVSWLLDSTRDSPTVT
jgi:hypothetical protein